MNDTRRDALTALCVAITGTLGYACLVYAVLQDKGDQIRALVNQITGPGV